MNDVIQKPDMGFKPNTTMEVVSLEDTRDLIEFKSTPEYFEKERSGKKPNTERVIETTDLRLARINCGNAKRIRIHNTATKEWFERSISDISTWQPKGGPLIHVISWLHRGGI